MGAQCRRLQDFAVELRHLLRHDFRVTAGCVVEQALYVGKRQVEPPQRLNAIEPRYVFPPI
ncbi:hypothetical protein D3C72_2470520 [compost metagenome]